MALSVLRLLRPYRLAGAAKRRVGRFFDGGYVMLDQFAGVEAAYSLGVNDDVSWDLDIARLGIPVFQYDHTIARLPEEHPLFHWKPKCLSGIADEEAGVETLERLIQQNEHERATNLLLKCDIEGSEWTLLEHTPNRVLQQFSQIVVEVHNMGLLAHMHHANNIRKALLNLTTAHRVVHVHANNCVGWEIIGGVPVPLILELTLARHDLGRFEVSEETFPTPLDMPNATERAQLYLGTFSY
jgi:hypothetical protein